jgi:hypothetical protein
MVSFLVSVVTSGALPESGVMSPAMMIIAAPQIVSGGLFLIAGVLPRRAAASGADPSA